MNQLILGDNLEILRKMDSETIDLVYLDPPFFSNRNYEVIWGDDGEIRSFQDRWSGGIDHYISWLKDRVIEMHRILKSTGSIFLHCDWHANSYIRVSILDRIFGEQNFRGEIAWQRTNSHNDAKKKLAVLKDTIWYYSKSDKYTYNPIYSSHSETYIENFYKNDDNDGKGLYALDNIASPNPRPNMMYNWLGFPYPPKGWRYETQTMQKLHDEGKIYYPTFKDGNFDFTKRPRLKRYLNEQKGTLLGDVWTDIQNVQAHAKEKIGYPTQKPEQLLERIIQLATNENDTVLDPFVGGGTTIAVADRINRQFIGIDQSVQAVKVSEFRLQFQRSLFSRPLIVKLHKYDYETLFTKNAFEFETWIIDQFGGIGNTKQKGDFGIDGKTRENVPIQVKQSENIGRNVVDNFKSACERSDKQIFERQKQNGKEIGTIIAFSFNKGAIQEVARLKNDENLIINLVQVADIVPIAKKPTLTLNFNDLGADIKKFRTVEFSATANSASGIEFFAWDFNYNAVNGFKPVILIDKIGKQTEKFKAGTYEIACKVVDNEGLENIEIVKLKINGVVQETGKV